MKKHKELQLMINNGKLEIARGAAEVWNTQKMVTECKLDPAKIIPTTPYFYALMSSSAWNYLRDSVSSYKSSQEELAYGLVYSFVHSSVQTIRANSKGDIPTIKPSVTEKIFGLRGLNRLEKETGSRTYEYDIYTTFYRIKDGHLEILAITELG